ncbi:transforming growth factor-beta-induced protein ig-h3 [Neocloeon triangulifer]|uniref:transforming growth factor-beta-induced protein ig-h3 n=1 Tax=Neocloeon triangulifer TaxID=2078957 RepID=UPI00286F9A64|nr:transforming growth factor-beta-induced protein ig-h3 [Neocloeon triangulifer]
MARLGRVCPLVLLLLLIVGGTEAAKKKKLPWYLKVGQEQGPNACVVEEIPGKSWRYWTECKYHNNRQICGQKTRLKYECCGGFHQLDSQAGCTGVNPMADVLQTAKHYGAAKFVEFVEQAGLTSRFKREGPFTLFAPIDKAFEKMSGDQRLRLVPSRQKNSSILLHAIGHRVDTDDIGSDTVLPSLYGLDLRINKYTNGMKTVNCVLLLRKDLQATNGVVHLVEKILEPYVVVPGKNIAEMIESDGRFSELAKALEGTKCKKRLENSQQSYTILAPSDEAFQKLSQGKLERLLSNPEIKEALLENHIIPHPTCLSAVTTKTNQRTLGKEKLEFDCDSKGVSISGQKMRNHYQIGTNGLLYMIDDLIFPQKAMSAMQIAENEKLFTFSHVLRTSGMSDILETMPNMTLFAPSEAAMYSLPKEELQQLKENKEKARKFVMYHVVEGNLRSDSMVADRSVRSLDNKNKLRVQLELNSFGVQGAKLEKKDLGGSNACMHIINKPLKPPAESAEGMLRTMGNFSYFVKGLSQVLKSMNHNGSVTVMAPTDKAFKELPEDKLLQYTSDRKFMHKIIKGHIADHMVTFSMLRPGLKYLIKTKHTPVYFSVDKLGRHTIGEAEVIQSDLTVLEGVVQILDTVLISSSNGHKK